MVLKMKPDIYEKGLKYLNNRLLMCYERRALPSYQRTSYCFNLIMPPTVRLQKLTAKKDERGRCGRLAER